MTSFNFVCVLCCITHGTATPAATTAVTIPTFSLVMLIISKRVKVVPVVVAALANAIEDVPHLLWDGTGDNPYFAFLALADAIIVTEDSVNMVTEAAGTGKPVYVQGLAGRSARLSRFHRLMRERGATRRFEGKLEAWSYAPINDTEVVASTIRRAIGLENKG